ncbi:HMG (high mobility group) box [Nesidiocoris tenuis]|nr:HMG (high mobility group) box [Nesidiocoris tenuis]
MDEKTSTEDKSSQCASEKPAIPMPVKRKKAKLTISRVLDKRRKRVPAKARADDVAAKRAYRECDLDRALFRWYSRRTDGQGRPANVTIADLANRALVLAKRLGAGDSNLKRIDDDWVANWSDKFGVRDFAETEERPVKSEDLETILDEYNDDQIYTGLAFEFDWTSLPDRNATRKLPDERIWLLMAGNKSGRHRTRILITGKEWRPDSLKHVNMLSQPVVYAGGGVGRITPDLFSWWFHREFAPAALLLNESGAVLVMESADYLPSPHDCVTANGKVKLVLYNPSSSAPSQHRFDQNLLKSELKTRYAMLLLTNLTLEPRWLTVPHVLSSFSLKEAFPLLHKAWLNVRPETFSRCWTTSAVASTEEDRIMLLELQWISHDVGLDVTDEDVKLWAYSNCGETSADPESVKPEPREDRDGSEAIPTASEAVAHLNKALLWMESEPIEPTYLLVIRDIITIAKQAGKMGLASGHPGSGLPFFCHNGDPLSQPPPAHMGIPPYQLDPKGGLTRPPMYPFSASQYHYPMLSPEISQVAASWHTPSMYPISSGSAGFRSPYPSSLPIGGPNLSSDFYRFSPGGLMSAHSLSPHSHPAIVTPGPKQELQSNDHNHRHYYWLTGRLAQLIAAHPDGLQWKLFARLVARLSS